MPASKGLPAAGAVNVKCTKAKTKAAARHKAAGAGRNGALTRALTALLRQKVDGEAVASLLAASGLGRRSLTAAEAMALAQVVKAIGGDTSCYAAVRDTLGEKAGARPAADAAEEERAAGALTVTIRVVDSDSPAGKK